MTTIQASTVASALINGGFPFVAKLVGPNNWVIHSQSQGLQFNVPVGVVNTFVTNQGVNGNVAEVEYS